jgi:hypothetical protein
VDGKDVRFFLQIIESPSPDEIFDGRTEGSLLRAALTIAEIPYCYNIAVNRKKFFDALRLFLERREQDRDALQILHLSMHGNREGVAFTDDSPSKTSFLTWRELGEVFTHIAQGELVVCMSSCYGYSGCRMAMSDGGTIPFLALVGNDELVNLDDAAIAYSAFYHRLFKRDGIPAAVDAMQRASGNFKFQSISGEDARRKWKQAQANQAKAWVDEYLRNLYATDRSE